MFKDERVDIPPEKQERIERLNEILEVAISIINQIHEQLESARSLKFKGSFLAGLANLITAAVKVVEELESIEAELKFNDSLNEEEKEKERDLIFTKEKLNQLLSEIKEDAKKLN